MSVKLMVEVLDHAPPDWTPAERLGVTAIAEWVRDSTRTGCPPVELIAHRAGIDVKSLSRMLRRLAAKGYELRVPIGVDKKGQTVYAHRGRRTVFRVPKLCPLPEHRAAVCAKWAGADASPDDETPEERADHRPPIVTDSEGEREDHRPPFEPHQDNERADHRPPKPRERADNERRKGGPPSAPSPQSPQKSSPQRASAHEMTKTSNGRTTPTHRQQPPQQRQTAVGTPETIQIILDALHTGGHPDATVADAQAIHRTLAARYRDRLSQRYLRGIADGSGFGEYYAAARQERDRADTDQRQAEQRRDRATAARAAIDTCRLCDHTGRTPTGGVCAHDPDLPARSTRGGSLARAELARRTAKDTAA